MLGLGFFERGSTVAGNQHVEAGTLQKGRQAVCNGCIVVG